MKKASAYRYLHEDRGFILMTTHTDRSTVHDTAGLNHTAILYVTIVPSTTTPLDCRLLLYQ